MVEDRKSTAKEELKWRAEFKTLGREAVRTTGSITIGLESSARDGVPWQQRALDIGYFDKLPRSGTFQCCC
jgi:hypothetical protein